MTNSSKANRINSPFTLLLYVLSLYLPALSMAADIEKIEVRGSQKTIVNKVYTQDNLIILPSEMTSLQRSVADIVSQVAGAELNGQGGLKQSYNIRGFSRSRIKTEIDGIPVITDRRAGNSSSFLPPEFISSVYLQKGPSSTLYGSGAMGGVISISTLNNSLANLGVSYQMEDQSRQVHGIFTTDDITLGLLHRQAENSQAANNTPLNSQFSQAVANLHYSATWRDLEFSLSTLLSRGQDIGKSSATFPTSRETIYPADDHWLSQIKISNKASWQVQLYHHNQTWQSQVSRLNNSNLNSNITRQNYTDYDSQTFGWVGSVFLADFTFGLEWLNRANVKISETEVDPTLEVVWQQQVTNADKETYSAFIERSWQYNKLSLNWGARFDQVHARQRMLNSVEKVTDSYTSTALSANYKLTEQHYFSAEIASAFRFPSISELFFSGETPRGNTLGNSSLSPEKSTGLQLNYRYQYSQGLTITANSYLYGIDNYIERFQINEETRSYKNSDQATIKGAEISALWEANEELQSTLSFQWQQGKNQQQQTIDDGLPTALKWTVNYQPTATMLQALSFDNQINYRFKKSTFGPSEDILGSIFTWQSSINWAVLPTMDIRFTMANVTNSDYRSSSDEEAPWQPQRSIKIAWQWYY